MSAGLNFAFTPEQDALRETVHRFASRELAPAWLRELDRTGQPPHAEIIPKMAALGFTGIVIPTEFGGSGGSCIDATVLLEELGRTSLAIASLLNFAIGFGAFALIRFGTRAQQAFYLPRIVSGAALFAFALTEPNAGSDAASVRTRARLDGDEFVINGSKQFITGAKEAPYLLVVTRSDPDAPEAARHQPAAGRFQGARDFVSADREVGHARLWRTLRDRLRRCARAAVGVAGTAAWRVGSVEGDAGTHAHLTGRVLRGRGAAGHR